MMQQTSVCSECGKQNDAGYEFCGDCGARLSVGERPQANNNQQLNSCPKCGKTIVNGQKFCGTCGAQFSWAVKLSSEVGRSTTPIEGTNIKKTTKRGVLQWIVLAWGIISFAVMGIALMPLMGMLNWINIPFAALGVIMGFVTLFAARARKWPCFVGTALCLLAVVVGSMRIIFGVGFI
jgi:DNA-directed RNA polymerase subunit RPC12/RpoP